MIDVRKLEMWRRPDLEAIVFAVQGQKPGDVAGDIIIRSGGIPRSIRFSIQQHDEAIDAPFVSLSGPEKSMLSNQEVARFMKYCGLHVVREISYMGRSMFVRSFEIRSRRTMN